MIDGLWVPIRRLPKTRNQCKKIYKKGKHEISKKGSEFVESLGIDFTLYMEFIKNGKFLYKAKPK
jgi:hypothetical protein